ncbi:MAG: hypothetical protein ACUVUG_07660 [Candidatus Aminicenantia bacterium]
MDSDKASRYRDICERIQKSIDGIKVYFYNAIEAKTGFALSIEQEHEGFLKAFLGSISFRDKIMAEG